ncbi:hypothetical protein, partial [Xanthobacter autotrophicus]|uniref:hypothetical protein n=1 Tax=Xanthobacter autotrophicus TaxID=280 RepID=UPI0024A7869B
SRGVATYQLLPDVLVDAELLRRLRLRAHANGPDGIEDLVTALRLVEGEPFSHLRRNGYGWLTEGDRLDFHLGAAIADIGHLVVTHALQALDLDLARWAAQTTVKGNPHADTAQLDLIAVMSANHDPH